MKADKKLSIKVKSRVKQQTTENPEVEMVTEWNIQRVIFALVALMFLLTFLVFYFSAQDEDVQKIEKTDTQNESDITPLDSIKTPFIKKSKALVSNKEAKEPLDKVLEAVGKDITTDRIIEKKTLSKPVEIEKYLSKNIIHAQLVKGFNKSGPYGKPDLPVMVNKTEAKGLFFFTEVKNMHGSTVFHEWLKEGKTIYKHKFIMRSNKGEMHTSKLFTNSSVGEWQVRIITSKGKVLHKVDFSVQRQ